MTLKRNKSSYHITKQLSIIKLVFYFSLFQIQGCKNNKEIFSPSLFEEKQPSKQKIIHQDIFYEEPKQQTKQKQQMQQNNFDQNESIDRYQDKEDSQLGKKQAEAYQQYYKYQRDQELRQKLLSTQQPDQSIDPKFKSYDSNVQYQAKAYQKYYQHEKEQYKQQRKQLNFNDTYEDLQASNSTYLDYMQTQKQQNKQESIHQLSLNNELNTNIASGLEQSDLSILDEKISENEKEKVFTFDELLQTAFTSKRLENTIKSILIQDSIEDICTEKILSDVGNRFSIVLKSQQFLFDKSPDNVPIIKGSSVQKSTQKADEDQRVNILRNVNNTTNLNSINSFDISDNLDLYEQELDETINQQNNLEQKRKVQKKQIQKSSLFQSLNSNNQQILLDLLQKSDQNQQFDESTTIEDIQQQFNSDMMIFAKRTQLNEIDKNIFTFLIIQQKLLNDHDYQQLLRKISVLKSIKQDSPYYKRTKAETNNLRTTLKKRYQSIVNQLNIKTLTQQLFYYKQYCIANEDQQQSQQKETPIKQKQQKVPQKEQKKVYQLDDQWTQKPKQQKQFDIQQYKRVNGFQ